MCVLDGSVINKYDLIVGLRSVDFMWSLHPNLDNVTLVNKTP